MEQIIKKVIAGVLVLASFIGLSVTVTGCGGGEGENGRENSYTEFEEYYGCPNAKSLPWYRAHGAQTHRAKKLQVRR